MWTVADKRFLHRLKVRADDPPPPLPRFQVLAAADGEYEVIDRLLKFRTTHTISAAFENPRSLADAIAHELNQKIRANPMNAPDIKPYLLEADRLRPDLRITNTSLSAFELLQLTLALAGPDWQHVGKTRLDGSQVAPPGFVPFDMALTRPDGQRETLTITGVSQDAAWHLPSRRQVKVIAFSAANDPGPWEHGPAKLTPYEIDPPHYRWHNPAVPQFGRVAEPMPDRPAPQPIPPPSRVLPKGEAFSFLKALDAFYRAPEGLQRPEGIGGDMEAIAQWFFQGVIEGRTFEEIIAQIRQSDEWIRKHRA